MCCLLELGNNLRAPTTVLRCWAQRRLIRKCLYCNQCNRTYGLNAYQNVKDGYRWYCKSCKYRRSVRDDLFFANCCLSLTVLLCLLLESQHGASSVNWVDRFEILRRCPRRIFLNSRGCSCTRTVPFLQYLFAAYSLTIVIIFYCNKHVYIDFTDFKLYMVYMFTLRCLSEWLPILFYYCLSVKGAKTYSR